MRWNWFSSQPRERKGKKQIQISSEFFSGAALCGCLSYFNAKRHLLQPQLYTQRSMWFWTKRITCTPWSVLMVTENPTNGMHLAMICYILVYLLFQHYFRHIIISKCCRFHSTEGKNAIYGVLRWCCLLKCRNKIERYIITTLTLALLLDLYTPVHSDRHLCFTSHR